jgi:hypothetical protein
MLCSVAVFGGRPQHEQAHDPIRSSVTATRGKSWGWPGVTPAAISTDPTAGAPSRPWLTSAKLHSSDASPHINYDFASAATTRLRPHKLCSGAFQTSASVVNRTGPLSSGCRRCATSRNREGCRAFIKNALTRSSAELTARETGPTSTRSARLCITQKWSW